MSNTIKTIFKTLNVITNSSRTTRDILLYFIISQTRCFIWNFSLVNEWMKQWIHEMDGWIQNWDYPFISCGATSLLGSRQPPRSCFEITLGDTIFGRNLLDEWLACRRDLYLTTHSTLKRQTSLHPAGSEPAIPASEWTQTVRPTGSAESPYAHQKCTLINLCHI